jgi:FtsZ-binding cell division protein ZapB
MISLEQVLLLEQKVESAVEKIQQLEAENDALRNKCSELTNALSAKSEQLKAYESDQQKIESGIIKAIDRLNSIENSVLKAAGTTAAKPEPQAPAQPAVPPEPPVPQEPEVPPAPEAPQMNFDSMDTVEEVAEEAVDEDLPPTEPDFIEDPVDEPVEESTEEGDGESADNLGFDIF